MEMRTKDVLTNIKGFNGYDYANYGLNKSEADVCIKALERRIPIIPEMMCDGDYHFCPVCKCGVNKDHNFCPGCGQALNWKGGVGVE